MKVGIWNKDKINGDNWAEVLRIERDKHEGCSLSSVMNFESGTTEADVENYIQCFYNETDILVEYEILKPMEYVEFVRVLGLTHGEETDTLYQHYCDVFNEKPDN